MRKIIYPFLFLFLFYACGNANGQIVADTIRKSNNTYKDFPYHPLAYYLDLSILTYHLYSQTLIWPFDPYYERVKKRKRFMKTVRKWTEEKGSEQCHTPSSINDFRGPGVLGCFENNKKHDPIIYRYASIDPWQDCVVNPDGEWIVYNSPDEVTRQIGEVYMCYRKKGGEEFMIERILYTDTLKRNGGNVLLCFEGGTGDKGITEQPASQSLMGFVLLRKKKDKGYDIDIAFRGSRSGSAARAILQAFSGKNAKGNPDWITDLGYDLKDSSDGAANITTTGKVNRGMMYSMQSILPAIFKCLNFTDSITNYVGPGNIYVTGHSLGGALAQHFVSAVLMGTTYNGIVVTENNKNRLKHWPWTNIKLITYSSPRAGNGKWAKRLTEEFFETDFFSNKTYDRNALHAKDASIIAKLSYPSDPAAYRVLKPTDPVTTGKIGFNGKHVGKTVYVRPHVCKDVFKFFHLNAHEAIGVREDIVNSFLEDSMPGVGMEYRSMREMGIEKGQMKEGSNEDMQHLVLAIKKYFIDKRIDLSRSKMESDFEIWKRLVNGQW